MAKTSTAPASAEKTIGKPKIQKPKKVDHPWKGQNVAFVGPFVYQERTIIMMEDKDSITPLVKKMGAISAKVRPCAKNEPTRHTHPSHAPTPARAAPGDARFDCPRARRRTRCSKR